jgi:hypothetical protein
MKVTAEISADHQHGPVITVCVDGVQVSVYLAGETGIVTTPDGQYGIEVPGPWHEARDQLAVMTECRR